MARKNFRATGGIDIDSSPIPTTVIQETITSNSAVTVDTIALDSFISSEYTITLKQGSKIRTSKVIMQTDGTSVDMTEFAITETGGTIAGVVVAATTASTNAVLQITATDAATTLVRYKIIRNIFTTIQYAPDAPTIGTATAGVGQASITFTAPADTGNSEISTYTATSNPGNIVASNSSSPIIVEGLASFTEYTFTVTATNAFGTSSPSSASNAITPISKPAVSGGTLSSDATYFYRAFTSTGNLVISGSSITMDTLIVAGGGNGGVRGGGGGGAGGVLYTPSTVSSGATYPVVIGAGGGNASSIGADTLALIASGGGYGGTDSGGVGGSGGSGGGGTWNELGGSGISGQGYNGGSGFRSFGTVRGGGGGGAAQVGYNTQDSRGGNGTSTFNDWLSAASLGENVDSIRYIGGGGGGASNNTSGGSTSGGAEGGLGGGGDGAQLGVNGLGNTGGGGGGGGGTSINNNGSAGTGGSGLVIVRYLKSAVD